MGQMGFVRPRRCRHWSIRVLGPRYGTSRRHKDGTLQAIIKNEKPMRVLYYGSRTFLLCNDKLVSALVIDLDPVTRVCSRGHRNVVQELDS